MDNKVGIIMGSDSDLPIMKEACDVLEEFGISYEIDIVSAHRTPNKMFNYYKRALDSNIKVIIAGAGGAAHLPGMVASLTDLPVIGVPIKTKSLNGIDSLYSIVQMPKGVPVATVAINGSENAAILAAKILATNDKNILNKLTEFRSNQNDQVIKKSEQLQKQGYQNYLERMRISD
ncbi:5-(carboxyamino)imidazole ribonucleotide mutase [Natranaerobius trueperi]|uniref:N5-carboxyaminoimidazole ribonucleotide mutase n=1 Tax=Natranaerobius trueperi TaxID=759412 RepID=A0A226C0I8_9FIRM|nr:5-(carboxyamino)imidazole ribonucleotide mutase [Natranaerobius trueperi]OWZ84746.1 5-(carboxyamino)imidazole ribonucleotide mutase [Natranaerobius trueperi]